MVLLLNSLSSPQIEGLQGSLQLRSPKHHPSGALSACVRDPGREFFHTELKLFEKALPNPAHRNWAAS